MQPINNIKKISFFSTLVLVVTTFLSPCSNYDDGNSKTLELEFILNENFEQVLIDLGYDTNDFEIGNIEMKGCNSSHNLF